MNFKIEKTKSYERPRVLYDPPSEIGYYSTDGESKYQDDNSEMKYLAMPKKKTGLKMDLNEGYDKYIHAIETEDNGYSTILKWMLHHTDDIKKHFEISDGKLNIDFVLTRSILIAISTLIYKKYNSMKIYATKLKSVIYLYNAEKYIETDEQKRRENTWGHKFEQFMVSDNRDSEPNTAVPVNENEKYFSILKGKLNHHRLLLRAEVDCVDPDCLDTPPPKCYVELKTCKEIDSERKRTTFKLNKLYTWYFQCLFTGMPKVICGFRDDNGVVKDIQTFIVNDMPKETPWSPDVCLNFLSKFLDHVKKRVVKEKAVYEFIRESRSDVIKGKVLKSQKAFLSEEYTSQVDTAYA